jgi:hypothetical protein
MSIAEQFETLSKPKNEDFGLIHAVQIKNYMFAKIGINSIGEPIILLDNSKQPSFIRNFRLKFIELKTNVSCTIKDADLKRHTSLSLIVFRSTDKSLSKYFFSIAETFVESLHNCNSKEQLLNAYENLIEIFRSLNESPVSTVQGLWAELFIICESTRPNLIAAFWHGSPTNKFDFEVDNDKLEIKSSRSMTRVHTFSADQLNADSSFNILIGSLFVIEKQNGKSVDDLIDELKLKLNHPNLFLKINLIAAKTLGAGLRSTGKMGFDESFAKQSLRFFDRKAVDRIEKESIPSGISDVHFKCDLNNIRPTAPLELNPDSQLFGAL